MAATVDGADIYFQVHLESSKWAAATPEQKAGALATAEAEINSLPLQKNEALQARINSAIFEQAVFHLKRDVKREELQAQGVTMAGINDGFYEHYGTLTYGIALAPRAKLLLRGCFAVGVIR